MKTEKNNNGIKNKKSKDHKNRNSSNSNNHKNNSSNSNNHKNRNSSNSNNSNSAQESLLRQYLRYVAATVASLMVYSLYTMVDGLFVSRGVNECAMSAVNLALPYTNVLFSVSLLFAVGAGTIIAIFLGQQKNDEANRLFTLNTVVLTVIGLLITAMVFLFMDPLVRLLGATEATYEYTMDYLRGLAPFSVFFIVSYAMEILIKTDGYPQKAFRTVIAGCLCNCLLDYIAIFLLHLGAFGAAVATGLSQLFVCLIYFRHFLCEKTTFHFTRFHFDFKIYRRLIPLGLSEAISELCLGTMIFLFNRVAQSRLGADGLVCYTVIAYVHSLVYNTLAGVSAAMQPLVSFHYGKEAMDNCRKLFRYGLCVVSVMEAVIFIVLQTGGGLIVRAYLGTGNAVLNQMAFQAMKKYSLCYLLTGLNLVTGGYCNATEHPGAALAVSTGRGLLFQAAALLLLSLMADGNVIWYAPAVGELCCFILGMWMMRSIRRGGLYSWKKAACP